MRGITLLFAGLTIFGCGKIATHSGDRALLAVHNENTDGGEIPNSGDNPKTDDGNIPRENPDPEYPEDCGWVYRQNSYGGMIASDYGILWYLKVGVRAVALYGTDKDVVDTLNSIEINKRYWICLAPGETTQGVEALYLKVIRIYSLNNLTPSP